MAEAQVTSLALVTGASRRLGRDFAFALARRGYAIALHCHSSLTEAQAAADEICALGVPAAVYQCDLTEPTQIAELFSFADSLGYALKILVNSAAVMAQGNLQNLKPDEYDSIMDLNMKAPLICAQYAAARMKSGGLIINISDVGAQKTWTGYPVYVASKSGLETLTRLLARTYAPAVRVNAIAPGLVYKSDELPSGEWDRLVQKVPMKRPAKSSEIISALDFLLSDEYVTGQTIVVDGGYSLI